ncbi:hypothetical protein BJ508DRAFT_195682, partial [Ascobolus immersus RN42]
PKPHYSGKPQSPRPPEAPLFGQATITLAARSPIIRASHNHPSRPMPHYSGKPQSP